MRFKIGNGENNVNDLPFVQSSGSGGDLVLKKGEGVDSIVQVVTWEGGTEEEPLDNKPKATGYNSMALGPYCEAQADFAVALNYNNKATGENSFAANTGSEAKGTNSFAANRDNHANGDASFAIGRSDYADGENSLAAGLQTMAKGKNSATFGEGTRTGESITTDPESGLNAMAMGKMTHANGRNALATGYNTRASGMNSFAGGSGSSATGQADFAVGFDTVASGGGSAAFGKGTRAKASYSLAGGDNSEVGSGAYYSIVHGKELRATAEAQAVFGKYNNPVTGALFMIGNGSADGGRQNAFVVKKDSIVVGSTELTEDEITQLKAIEDEIETALDSILAIQNKLIGGDGV